MIVRFLKYEKKAFIDKHKERNVRRLMMAITLLTFIPSVFVGFRMVRVSVFEAMADKYVAQVFNFKHTRVIECNKHFETGRHRPEIELVLLGEPLGDEVIENARAQMPAFGLEKTDLTVRQASTGDKVDLVSLQKSYSELLAEKNEQIDEMKSSLSRYKMTNVEVGDISQEVGVLVPGMQSMSLMKGIDFDVQGRPLDTLIVCVITPQRDGAEIDRATLMNWLRKRTRIQQVKLFIEPTE